MQRFFGIAQDVNGNVIPSCTVRVRLATTATDATLYSDTSYTPLANPFTSEVDGAYQFYARNGRYDIFLTKTGYTFDDDDTANILLDDSMSVISPAQITSNQNDYSPTNGLNATTWRINSDAARTITGIAAGYAQQRITLTNVGSFSISLANESSSSTAANRIVTGVAANLAIAANQSLTLYYDLTSARWRVVSEAVGPTSTNAVQTLTRVVADATTSNSTSETDILSYSVAGGTLGTSSQLRITVWVDQANTSGGNVLYTFRVRYGGTQIILQTDTIATGTSQSLSISNVVTANNATNAQKAYSLYQRANVAWAFATGTAAIDSTTAQTLRFTGQMDTASANASFTAKLLTLEWLP